METNSKNKPLKKWILPVLLFFLMIITKYYIDTNAIRRIEYFHQIISILLFIALLNSIRKLNIENNRVKSGKQYSIENQIDKMSFYLSIFFGIFIIVLFIYSKLDNTQIFENLYLILFGVILIISAFRNKKSIVLNSTTEYVITSDDFDFKIESKDIEIIFSEFQIHVTKSDSQVIKLKELILDYNEAIKITNWIDSKLNSSNMSYYWIDKIQNKKVKIDTLFK
jgi:hypothetical protein